MLKTIVILILIQNLCLIYGRGIELDKYGNQIIMGVSSSTCDDAKISLEVDWDGSPKDYTCSNPDQLFPVRNDIETIEECENVPDNYFPSHHCMDERLVYDHILPTHAKHRPLWPKFGEYTYVPPQRWSHNVEHGAIIMLYHPCADKNQVSILRELVVNCIRKHVITAYTLLPEDRPFALVGWGCRLLFSKVDNQTIISFIKERGLHGPEGNYPKEGQYDLGLLELATIPSGSDLSDTNLCPKLD